MRLVLRLVILGICCGFLASAGIAQRPRDRPSPPGASTPDRQTNTSLADSIVERMMAFDKNNDGKLSRNEITDERLLRLFDRADANKDGVVTRKELVALATTMADDEAANGGRRGRFGPPGRPGGRGPGGPGGFGGPPRPGQILPPFLQEELNLTDAQKRQLEKLQKEVDGKLARILTSEQQQQLREMRRFGPGGPPPGGPGGRRPGGPPPDDNDGPPARRD